MGRCFIATPRQHFSWSVTLLPTITRGPRHMTMNRSGTVRFARRLGFIVGTGAVLLGTSLPAATASSTSEPAGDAAIGKKVVHPVRAIKKPSVDPERPTYHGGRVMVDT